MYKIEKYLNMLYKDIPTNFLDPQEQIELKMKLKKNDYNIYKPYKDSEKNIFYKNRLPKVILYEIICKNTFRHQDILGSLFSLNIDSSLFGDILIIDNRYFFYTLDIIKPYLELNFTKVKNSRIELKELELCYLENYERKYEKLNIIVPSNRIDIIISRIIKTNRDTVKDLIKDKKVILNYNILNDNSKQLMPGDTFSIRKYGKYKYNGIINNTKKDNLVIEILKYI